MKGSSQALLLFHDIHRQSLLQMLQLLVARLHDVHLQTEDDRIHDTIKKSNNKIAIFLTSCAPRSVLESQPTEKHTIFSVLIFYECPNNYIGPEPLDWYIPDFDFFGTTSISSISIAYSAWTNKNPQSRTESTLCTGAATMSSNRTST